MPLDKGDKRAEGRGMSDDEEVETEPWIVRMKRDAVYSGPRIVGVWVSSNDGDLWILADQVGDPTLMEAAPLIYGGVMMGPPNYAPQFDEYLIVTKWRALVPPDYLRTDQ